jgi:hypothetical protein
MVSAKKLDGAVISQITLPHEYYAGSLISVVQDYMAYATKGG